MASSRKTGKYGSLFLHASTTPALASVVKYADTFNWRFESEVEMNNCTRKGEGASRFMPGAGTARFTCESHITGLSALLILADDTLPNTLVRCAFKLVTLATEPAGSAAASDNLTVAGQQIIQGFGWVARASLAAPFDNPINEEFEMQVDGEWEFTPTT